MPHAVNEYESQHLGDDDLIASLLGTGDQPQDNSLDWLNRPLDAGEKADDAQDFEDISDNDLPDEEDAADNEDGDDQDATRETTDDQDATDALTKFNNSGADVGFEDDPDMADGDDDLFGDDDQALFNDEPQQMAPAAPTVAAGGLALPSKNRIALPGALPRTIRSDADNYGSPSSLAHSDDSDLALDAQNDVDMEAEEEEEEEEDGDVATQRRLFAEMAAEREERARRGASYEPRPAAETDLETFFNIWPTYDSESRPRFTELFPQRKGVYAWKSPAKPPKPLHPTKLNLDLLPDQEKSFHLPGTATARDTWSEQHGTIHITSVHKEQEDSDEGMDLDEVDEDEVVGGVSWQDLTLVCEDWNLPSISSPEPESQGDSGIDMYNEQDHTSSHKKRKLADTHFDLKEAVAYSHHFLSFEDPERATARVAKHVQLDMNDPGLLLDESAPLTQPKKIRRLAGDMGREAKSAAARDMSRRYNISNDDAYELLKENHQHKVRSTLGSMAVEHSLPATKLQFPFYRVSLEEKQKRMFHRPTLTGERHERTIRFSRPKKVKRKELKGKDPTAVFVKAEDLSMADNSNALLLEYSEEQPVMLSNFGMGNRLINYYRRKDDTDTSRPKEELGETQVLLPQDRSPFANFGQVNPGEMVPTIHNGLYRAPIFKHESKSNDFLLITNTSNMTGRKWFMRNIENIHAVGQQFPSVEVPGEHSRKVTDAAKRRLRAISYRVHKKYIENRGPALTNEVVKNHLPGSDIAQNRGKMREFMQYDKNNALWQLKTGEQIPDAETMRAWIKPEDICVLDSMQVGVQHLKDLGLRKDGDENDDDATNEDSNIELLLAPWNTTKNFLNACQGKAMLQLHGEGDPTARGEGFSLIKTSMKGGFVAYGESVAERLDAKKIKENGGHSYNVAKQQRAYDESIRRIWKAQHESLASTIEHSDVEDDIDDTPENSRHRAGETPRSSFGTPSAFGRRDDDTASQYSKFSQNQNNDMVMYIDRTIIDKNGETKVETQRIDNPRVIAAYKKRKDKEILDRLELESVDNLILESAKLTANRNNSAYNIVPTGDRDRDAVALKKYGTPQQCLTNDAESQLTIVQIHRVQDEMDRLKRNMDRRKARERAKGIVESPSEANSPGADAGDGPSAAPTGKKGRAKKNTEGTARKCANCGQVGHIRTNKKSATALLTCTTCRTPYPQDTKPEEGGSSNGGAPQQKPVRKRKAPNKKKTTVAAAGTAAASSPPSSASSFMAATPASLF